MRSATSRTAAAATSDALQVVMDDSVKTYPTSSAERAKYVNPRTNKPVTAFQFQVYDLCAQIPQGSFSTYKAIADKLGSHPRPVGQALKINPFSPLPVPCHRVVATDMFIGGYSGQWGKGTIVDRKRKRLADEGVAIDPKGYIETRLRKKALHAFPADADADVVVSSSKK